MPMNRGYGGFLRRGRAQVKKAFNESNHCELATSTTGGTELTTSVFTGVDPPTNRGAHIRVGGQLKRVLIRMWSTTDPTPAGKHQCMLLYRPGGSAFTTTAPIAAWYLTTEPLTEDSIDARKYILGRRPHTTVTSSTPTGPVYFVCAWRGNRHIYDGDDVVLAQLDTNSTAWTLECEASVLA